MIIRPPPDRPTKQPVRLRNRQIVDARMTPLHQSLLIELPVLIPIRPKPLPSGIMALITEPHRNPVPIKRPQLFDQSVLQLPRPFPRQKSNYLLPARNKLRPVAPNTVHRISQRNTLRITRVPTIFSGTHLQNGCLACKWRNEGRRRSCCHSPAPYRNQRQSTVARPHA